MTRARSYLCLCKAKISVFASLSAAAGLFLSAWPSGRALTTVCIGVFLTACGACALNQYQERSTDALMARTAGRPLPAGRIKPVSALFFAITLICLGCLALSFTGTMFAPLLGLGAVLCYNGFYTRFKTQSAFAAIPGAFIGAIPPAIGWTAAGGSLLDPRLAALSFFFFLWQIPHFLVHVHSFGREYEKAGLPSLTTIFTGAQLDRLAFQWILATAVSLPLLVLFGLIHSSLVRILFLAVSLWFVVEGIGFIRHSDFRCAYVFQRINYFMLIALLLMFVDKFPRIFP
jgi:protoheme IX farnesyltransferase